MISIEEARQRIDDKVKPLQPKTVPVSEAIGCCLTDNLSAPIDVPTYRSSAMDGIAVRYADLERADQPRLSVASTVAAGDDPSLSLANGTAVKIMTGAPVPEGADTVIPVEKLRFEGDDVIIEQLPECGSHVRPKGDDIKSGDLLYTKDSILTPVDAGVLSSIGITEIEVIPRPSIALLITGSELAQPGEQLRPGQLYNSNLAVLEALLARNGSGMAETVSIVRDDPEILTQTLKHLSENYDLIITSGGVSMGEFDYIPSIVQELGSEAIFHKVRVKPGKPTLVARISSCWLAGLPGNPVSVVTSYHLYVRRIVARMMSLPNSVRTAQAEIADDLNVSGGRFCLIGARLEETADGIRAFPSQRQKSGRLSSIKGMNGFVVLDSEKRSVKKGEPVKVEWLY